MERTRGQIPGPPARTGSLRKAPAGGSTPGEMAVGKIQAQPRNAFYRTARLLTVLLPVSLQGKIMNISCPSYIIYQVLRP